MRRSAHWGGLTALGTVVAWTPALAQTAGVAPTGDVRHLTIATQVTTTYDSNVSGVAAADAQLRRLTPEDVYVSPSVTIDGLLPVNRESIFLVGSLGYNFYARDTILNRERVEVIGGASAQLFRCLQQLKGSYARAQSRLEELLPGPNGASVSPQDVATSASVSFDLACPRAGGVYPTVSVTHSIFENNSKFYQATNNNSTSVQAGLSYARPGFGAIQTFGSFTTVAYDNPFVLPFPPFQLNGNYDLYAGGVSYNRPVGSRLIGTVSVSYSSLRQADSSRSGFSGVTYSSELSYQMSSRLLLHATVSRAMRPTNEVGAAYLIDNTRQIDATYSAGPRLKLTLGGFDDPTSYQGGLIGFGKIPNLLTNGRTDRVFASANMMLSRRLSVVLDVDDEHRSSNVTFYNYTRQRVSLTLKSVF